MGTEMDWDKLRIFHAVADAGSLTHAGDALHLSQSAVSRQIRSLEESRYERFVCLIGLLLGSLFGRQTGPARETSSHSSKQ